MSPKPPTRKITVLEKLSIIVRHERGEKNVDIARAYHMPHSTVSTIVKSKPILLKRLGNDPGWKSNQIVKELIGKPDQVSKDQLKDLSGNPDQILTDQPEVLNGKPDQISKDQPENLINEAKSSIKREVLIRLAAWYVKSQNGGEEPSFPQVNFKAMEFCKEITKSNCHSIPLQTTRRWFQLFRKQFKKYEETNRLPEKPNNEGDVSTFLDLSRSYKPRQVFCVAETVLNWKQMPTEPMSSCIEGNVQDRFSVLLGGNAQGDFKIKPVVVYHLENPPSLREVAKDDLPVIWRNDTKLELTKPDFTEWFICHFCPVVLRYCKSKGIPEKVLLVLDANAGYPSNLNDFSDNVKVLYVSTENVPYLASTNYMIFKIFKAHYLTETLSNAMAVSQGGNSDSLIEYWHNYNVSKAISNISAAWDAVKPFTMNVMWTNLYQHSNEKRMRRQHVELLKDIVSGIVDLVKGIGPEDISPNDVLNIVELKTAKPSSSELKELEKQRAREQFMDVDECIVPTSNSIRPPLLNEALRHIESAMAIFKNFDTYSERSSAVCENIEKALSLYR